jgi:hypothetical protein
MAQPAMTYATFLCRHLTHPAINPTAARDARLWSGV